ncbi:MAG TPA: hypothetical protein VKZ83_03075, partial [Phototrophicaceae bacterium]|nr:hypothetical protein [Phototrophicaceae bacterium]
MTGATPHPRHRGARLAAGAAVTALLLAGCADGERAAAPEPGQTSAATQSPTEAPEQGRPEPKSSPAQPVADPEHAVDPPGRRKDRLWSADILIQWDKPLSDEVVEAIEKLDDVAHTERIGLGQVSIENRVLTIAAV